ncbi:hypothetical protein BT69DRAFT_1283265 [Atractiella rhizophila]|nr:hypothetical protein BT69DRAFT_1283265 [Atractiella rhizophila]
MGKHSQNYGFLARRQPQPIPQSLADLLSPDAADDSGSGSTNTNSRASADDSSSGGLLDTLANGVASLGGGNSNSAAAAAAGDDNSNDGGLIGGIIGGGDTTSGTTGATTQDTATPPTGTTPSTTSSTSSISLPSPNASDSTSTTVSTSSESSTQSTTSSSSTQSSSTTSSRSDKTTSTPPVVQTSTQFVTSSGTTSGVLGSQTSAPDSHSSGLGTGSIIGAVAGVIVGLVALSAIVAYFYKKKNKDFDEHEDIFRDNGHDWDRSAFKRDSQRLDDDDPFNGSNSGGSQYGGHNRDMSYASSGRGQGATTLARANTGMSNFSSGSGRSMAAYMGAGNLARQNTTLPGAQRGQGFETPRPPSMIHRHVVNNNALGPMPSVNYGNQGGYGAARGYGGTMMQQRGLDRSNTVNSQGSQYSAYQGGMGGGFGNLQRENSVSSNYSQPALPPLAFGRTSPTHANPFADKLSILHEDDSEETFYDPQGGYSSRKGSPIKERFPSRSGTPVNANPQQVHYGMARGSDSASINYVVADPQHDGYEASIHGGSQNGHAATARHGAGYDYAGAKEDRAKRTLSVRNGGLDDVDKQRPVSTSDAYGGM